MTRKPLLTVLALLAFAVVGLVAQGKPASSAKPAAHAGPAMMTWTPEQGEWIPIPGTNAKMKVVKAAPGQAPTDLYIWQLAGTDTPLHWHSSDERIYNGAGEGQYRMWKGEFSATLGPGTFALVPARMIHQARCVGKQDCFVLVHTDRPFDVHVVDENGKEILPPKPAMKK